MERPPSYESHEKVSAPVFHVKNRIIWKAPETVLSEYPGLDIAKLPMGSDSELGLCLSFDPDSQHTETDHTVLVQAGHGRSGTLQEKEGGQKSDWSLQEIDLKGIGYVNESDQGLFIDKWVTVTSYGSGDEQVKGLASSNYTLTDALATQKISELGVPVVPTLAILECLELPVLVEADEFMVMPVTTLHSVSRQSRERADHTQLKHPFLPPSYVPVIQIRAFGIKERVSDIVPTEVPRSVSLELLKKAQDLLIGNAHETNFEPKRYFDALLIRCATSIATMHSHDFTHSFINPSNLPLDGRIVDCDSVHQYDFSLFSKQATEPQSGRNTPFESMLLDVVSPHWKKDTWGMIPTLIQLAQDISVLRDDFQTDSKQITESFLEIYEKTFRAQQPTVSVEDLENFQNQIRRFIENPS